MNVDPFDFEKRDVFTFSHRQCCAYVSARAADNLAHIYYILRWTIEWFFWSDSGRRCQRIIHRTHISSSHRFDWMCAHFSFLKSYIIAKLTHPKCSAIPDTLSMYGPMKITKMTDLNGFKCERYDIENWSLPVNESVERPFCSAEWQKKTVCLITFASS